jgi:hypothetical protein
MCLPRLTEALLTCVRSYDLQPDPADADCGGAIDAKAATYTMFTQVRPVTVD